MSQNLPTTQEQILTAQNDVVYALAEDYGMTPDVLYDTLKRTVFSAARNDAEFYSLCLVARQYGLNPLLKEIYAFPAKGGGVVPLVGIDGYVAMANRQPDFDHAEFRYSEQTIAAGVAKAAPEWIECCIWKKGHAGPTVAREYLEECYRQTEPWRTHPRRMLRHKAFCQAVRLAYGFSGVYSDIDEAESVTVAEEKPNVNQAISAAIEAPVPAQPKRRGRPPKQQAQPAPAQPAPAPAPEPQPEPVQEAQPAQEAVAIEAAFDDYVFDAGIDPIKANDVCMRLVQDGAARDLVDAKRQFVDHSMTV